VFDFADDDREVRHGGKCSLKKVTAMCHVQFIGEGSLNLNIEAWIALGEWMQVLNFEYRVRFDIINLHE